MCRFEALLNANYFTVVVFNDFLLTETVTAAELELFLFDKLILLETFIYSFIISNKGIFNFFVLF